VQLLASPPWKPPVMKRPTRPHGSEDSDDSEGTVVGGAARWQLHVY
jgi:hypothetical protein